MYGQNRITNNEPKKGKVELIKLPYTSIACSSFFKFVLNRKQSPISNFLSFGQVIIQRYHFSFPLSVKLFHSYS